MGSIDGGVERSQEREVLMTKNEGTVDRIIRVVIGVTLLTLVLLGTVTGAWAWVAGIAGVAALVTGALGYCGLYSVLGIRTCPLSNEQA